MRTRPHRAHIGLFYINPALPRGDSIRIGDIRPFGARPSATSIPAQRTIHTRHPRRWRGGHWRGHGTHSQYPRFLSHTSASKSAQSAHTPAVESVSYTYALLLAFARSAHALATLGDPPAIVWEYIPPRPGRHHSDRKNAWRWRGEKLPPRQITRAATPPRQLPKKIAARPNTPARIHPPRPRKIAWRWPGKKLPPRPPIHSSDWQKNQNPAAIKKRPRAFKKNQAVRGFTTTHNK